MSYQQRYYREWEKTEDLTSFSVTVSESDLRIKAETDCSEKARESLLGHRAAIEKHIGLDPAFAKSLKPLPADPLSPRIIKMMCEAGIKAGVGPMAAVAGVVSDLVGNDLLDCSKQVIVENGGDIFVKSLKDRVVGVYAGRKRPAVNIEIPAGTTPCGICTSSGNLGHSLSLGKADSVTVIAGTACLADAAATAAGNLVRSGDDIERALDHALGIDGVRGVLIIVDGIIGIKGDVKLYG